MLLPTLKSIIREAEMDTSGQISPKLREKLQSVEKNIESLTKAISDFKELTKIESDKMKVGTR